MSPQVPSYHHGDLRAALINAALDIARESGVGGLRLREITRVAGVSPNAAYRHFEDLDALILAAALEAQARLADAMGSRMAVTRMTTDMSEVAVENLRCVGLGYIDFALKEPGWFELALVTFDPHAGKGPAVTVGDQVPLPFQLLINALDGMVNAGALAPERRLNAEWSSWSAVHGFSDIATRGPLRDQDPEMLNALGAHVVESVIRALTSAST
jgi:AcrR family transcriptional regulator